MATIDDSVKIEGHMSTSKMMRNESQYDAYRREASADSSYMRPSISDLSQCNSQSKTGSSKKLGQAKGAVTRTYGDCKIGKASVLGRDGMYHVDNMTLEFSDPFFGTSGISGETFSSTQDKQVSKTGGTVQGKQRALHARWRLLGILWMQGYCPAALNSSCPRESIHIPTIQWESLWEHSDEKPQTERCLCSTVCHNSATKIMLDQTETHHSYSLLDFLNGTAQIDANYKVSVESTGIRAEYRWLSQVQWYGNVCFDDTSRSFAHGYEEQEDALDSRIESHATKNAPSLQQQCRHFMKKQAVERHTASELGYRRIESRSSSEVAAIQQRVLCLSSSHFWLLFLCEPQMIGIRFSQDFRPVLHQRLHNPSSLWPLPSKMKARGPYTQCSTIKPYPIAQTLCSDCFKTCIAPLVSCGPVVIAAEVIFTWMHIMRVRHWMTKKNSQIGNHLHGTLWIMQVFLHEHLIVVCSQKSDNIVVDHLGPFTVRFWMLRTKVDNHFFVAGPQMGMIATPLEVDVDQCVAATN